MAIVLMSDPVFDTEVIATAIDVWRELYRGSKKASTTTRSDKGLTRDHKVSDEPLGDLHKNKKQQPKQNQKTKHTHQQTKKLQNNNNKPKLKHKKRLTA